MSLNREDFLYKAFFRSHPPAIPRLAFIQLIMEGVDFSDESKWEENWNLIWDRSEQIIKCISKTREARILHKRLINERTF
jgi:hypothetical protein